MCVVSMVSDWGGRWGNPYIPPALPQPYTWPVQHPGIIWTAEMFQEFKDLMDKVRKLEEQLGVVDCEDPAKQKWMDNVTESLKKISEKLDG